MHNPDILFFSTPFIEHMLDVYFSLRKSILSMGVPGRSQVFACPKGLPSGLHALFLAMLQCDTVDLFGFSYTDEMLSSRADKISPRLAPTHAWDFDILLIRLLFLAGKVRLCTA